MVKNRTFLMYAAFVFIMILSFAIPKLITKIQDEKLLSDKYTINKKIQTLNES